MKEGILSSQDVKRIISFQCQLGRVVRSARLEMRQELATFANETGLSIEHLKYIESGRGMPDILTLVKISFALHRRIRFDMREHY